MIHHDDEGIPRATSRRIRRLGLLGAALSGLFLLLALAWGCGEGDRGWTAAMSDEQIESMVRSQLAQEHPAQAQSIGVSSADGVVTLTGQVATEADKEQIKDAAEEVDGVEDVRNELQVVQMGTGRGTPPVGAPPEDRPMQEEP